jgi:hypothetical protein
MEPNEHPELEPTQGDPAEVIEDGRARTSGWGKPAAFVAAGLVAGGVLAGTVSAMAADDGKASPSASPDAGTGYGRAGGAPAHTGKDGTGDQSQPQRSDESLLTGDTAAKVKAAALATYPGATILRVESDSDGVYEAHLTTSDGTRVTVEVGADFTVTGTESGGPGGRGGPGGTGGPGDGRHGGGPGGTPPSGSPEASPSGSSA